MFGRLVWVIQVAVVTKLKDWTQVICSVFFGLDVFVVYHSCCNFVPFLFLGFEYVVNADCT